MSKTQLAVYHSLPAPLRDVAASLRGYWLRSWRYGSDTDQLVAEILEREKWSAAQWQTYQDDRLAFVLHRAATRVPYYRDLWAGQRRNGNRAAWEYLENWPILEKDPIRENPRAFVADDCNIRQMFHDHTSGTTNIPLDLWQSRETVKTWYAYNEARWRLWYGVSRRDRWAILGEQLVTPVQQRHPPFWVWNSGLNQLYLSSHHLAPDLVPYYLDALANYQVTYILGYSASIYNVAQVVLKSGRRDLKMRVVVTNAEPLFPHQREVISEAFQCPVRETYGVAEIVVAAGECAAGRLHLWPDVCQVEVIDNGQAVQDGAIGELICTGLINADMPLIRYRIGDRAALSINDNLCSCKRMMPCLEKIDGRVEDAVYTADGRCIGQVNPMASASLRINGAQLVQETLTHFRIRYVAAPGYTPHDGQTMVEHVRARVGDVQVTLEQVDHIPNSANGKFRAVICNLPPEQKQFYRQQPDTPSNR